MDAWCSCVESPFVCSLPLTTRRHLCPPSATWTQSAWQGGRRRRDGGDTRANAPLGRLQNGNGCGARKKQAAWWGFTRCCHGEYTRTLLFMSASRGAIATVDRFCWCICCLPNILKKTYKIILPNHPNMHSSFLRLWFPLLLTLCPRVFLTTETHFPLSNSEDTFIQSDLNTDKRTVILMSAIIRESVGMCTRRQNRHWGSKLSTSNER